MKKMKRISLILCLVLLTQCLLTPVSAAETTDAATEATIPLETEMAFGTVCIQNGCRTIEGRMPLHGSARMMETSQAAFVYEVNTGTVIYSYNPDMKLSPGTLSKMVTALVAIENCDLDEVVTCSEGIQSKVPGSAIRVKPDLKSGEKLTVRDLLHGLLLRGGNDAAVALAEHVSGTTAAYVTLMNQRVRQMGCTNTEFGNISGLDTATNYSTARDMAKIVTEAIKNETFAEIFGAKEYTIPATNLEKERQFYTTNYLIDDHSLLQFYNTRVTGGLASYTDNSGAGIACTAEYNNMKLVCVSLGGIRTYEENGYTPKWYGNFDEITELMNFVFNNFKINRIIYDGMALNQWAVAGGENEVVGMSTVNVDSVVPASANMSKLYMDYKVVDGGLSAPVKKGDLIATMEVKYLDSCLTEVEIYAMGDVKAAGNSGVSVQSTATKDDSDTAGFMSVVGTICVIILGIVGVYLAYNSYMRSRIRARRRKRRAARRRSR